MREFSFATVSRPGLNRKFSQGYSQIWSQVIGVTSLLLKAHPTAVLWPVVEAVELNRFGGIEPNVEKLIGHNIGHAP